MEESLVEWEETFMADEQASVVAEVSKGALDFPAPPVAPQRPAILQEAPSTPAMRTDQLDATGGEPLAQPLCVVSAVTDEPRRAIARPAPPGTRHLHALQSFFREADFRGRGAKESTSQRYTRAVCHHHPLCTFATFGFTHAEPPFLALAKLPSRNTSSQLRRPCASNSERNMRQILSHTSSCSQSRKRRQQVLSLGYRSGRSRQRAPLRKTHRIPSKTSRSSERGRPDFRSGGKSGWIISHWRSESSVWSCIPSFPHQSAKSYKHKMWDSGKEIHAASLVSFETTSSTTTPAGSILGVRFCGFFRSRNQTCKMRSLRRGELSVFKHAEQPFALVLCATH